MSLSDDIWAELNKKKKTKPTTKTTTKPSTTKATTKVTTKANNSKVTTKSSKSLSDNIWAALDDVAPVSSVSSNVANRMTVGDIAPTKKKDKEDKWYNSGLFEDGWDFGDVTKTILGIDEDSASLKELTWNSAKKGYYNARYGEESFKAMDGLANEKDVYAKILAGDEYQFTPGNKFAEGVSGAFELIGQQARQFSNPTTLGMAGTAAVGAFALGQAGPQALAPEEVITVPGAAIAGFSAGSAAANFQIEAGHAYNEMLEAGISEKTAKRVATAVGGVNAGLELLQVDELLDAYKVTKATGTTKNFTKKILDELVDRGVDVAKETAQEVAQEGVTIAGVQAASKIDNDEWAYTADNVKSRLADTAKSSALSFGMMNVPATVKNSVSIAKDHNQTKWIRETEQKVTDRVYENLVAEAEKDGRKLTKQEKAEIRDSVTRDLEKGGISTDLIESVLDEEGYNAFQAEKDNFFTNTKKAYNEAQTREAAQLSQLQKQLEELVDAPNTVGNSKKYDSIVSQITELTENPESNALRAQLDAEAKRINQIKDQLRTKVHAMVKGTKLEASYDELIRKNQKFTADATQYQGEYARKTIQNFVDSGLADNTTEFHEQADWLAKLAEGRQLTFKLTSDEQLKGTVYDVKGKRVNAFIDESTGEITLNIDSNDGVKTAAGHDVSHTVEGTEHYAAYQDHLFKFAIEQEGQDSFNARLKHYEELYKGREDTTPEKELTAQLMGEYGFTDQAFVDRLLATDKNLFQKILDEIKYMYRLATAGSKAQRELEKAMHMYEKAWHEGGTKNTADSGVKYNLSNVKVPTREELDSKPPVKVVDISKPQTQGTFAERRKQILSNVDEVISKPYRNSDTGAMIFLTKQSYTHAFSNSGELQLNAAEHLPELIENAVLTHAEPVTHGSEYASGIYTFFSAAKAGRTYPVKLKVKEYTYSGQDLPKNIKEYFDNNPHDYAASYDTVVLEVEEIEESPTGSVKDMNLDDSFLDPDGLFTINVADLLNLVKGDSEKYIPKPSGTRFSLSDSVEESKDLMALHNLHSSELLKQLKMGGMAYPSIAITKPEMFSHDGFGEVSVILHKDAIDPKKSKYNKIYSADAYTPTFPNVDYEASEQVAANITSKVNALYDQLPEYYQRSLRSLRDYTNIDDQLNRWGGEQRLAEKYADDYSMKQLYLAEKGEAVPVEKKSTETRMTDYQMKLYQTVADIMGEDVLKSFNEKGSFEKLGMARMAWLEEHGDALKNIYAEDWSSDGTMTKEEALEIANEQKPIYWKGEIDRALAFIKTGGVTVTETDDIGTTQAKIDEKIAGSDYKQWVDNLFGGIEGRSGIRNGRDIFTPSGNRRSFSQTHDPLTVDNIVKAMRKENQTGQGAFGGGSILGASAKEFGSIDEVKKNSGKLGVMDKAEHEAITDEINDTFWDIARRYANGNDIIDAQEAIAEAVSKNESKAGIARYLKQYDYVYKYDDSLVDEIIELRDYIRSLPTPYFEAKPRRGVGFDEVAAFVIPYDADVKLKQELLNRGYNIAEYDPKVEGDRQRVVNQFEEYKFSLSNGKATELKNGDVPLSKFKYNPKQEFAPSIPAPIRSDVLPGKRQSVSEMFPDEPDIAQAEYDNLVAVKEATEARLAELAASADFDNPDVVSEFERINAEWVEASNRLLEMDNERSERIDSLSDADAPPEMDAPYYESEPTTLTKKATADIVRDVRASLALSNQQMADCKDIIEQYRTGKIQTREQLIDVLQNKFGSYTETEVDERLAELKKAIRTRRINVSDTIKHGIADYASVMRSNRGKILFAKDGLGVDEVYKELQEDFGDYLNEDEQLSPENMFRQLVEIVNTPHNKEVKRTKDIGNIEEAADLIINGIGEFKRNQDLALSNRESKQAFESLMRQADRYAPADDIAPVAKSATTPKTTVSKKESVAPVKPAAKQTSGKVAEVLTKASKKPKEGGIGGKVVSALVDKGAVFEKVSLDSKNMEVQAKWNYALPTNTEARAQYFMENGENGVKSLKSVMKEVNKAKKTDAFYSYLYHVHNIDRMTLEDRFGVPNKAVFGDSITADISRKKAAQLLKQNPEFRKWAQDIYNINKQVRTKLVEGGLITQEVADLWEKMYPHFVPTTRVDKNGLNVSVPLDTNKTGVNNPVKRATGGNSDIEPLFNTMAQRIEQTYRAIARNSFGIELKNTLGTALDNNTKASVDEMIDTIEMQDELLKQGGFGVSPTFTVFENGERVEFEITEDMYDALKPTNKILAYRNPAIKWLGDNRRNLLTVWNPVFALYRNPIKDIQDVAINSQHAVRTYLNVPNAIYQMVANGQYATEYHQNGGKSNTYFDSRKNEFKAEDNLFKKVIGMPVRAIENAGEFIEEIPRLAEYIASRQQGRSVERSMLDAARVTTNFAAGGDFTKFLNSHGFTFLNASVQGASQHVRNFREATKLDGFKGFTKTLAKYVIAGVPGLLLNGLLWDDDEDYEELSDYVKENYYVVAKTDEGKFIRIPKGRTTAVMHEVLEQMQNLVTGDDEVDFSTFFELFLNNIAPNNPLKNNILSPIIQAANNNAWYEGDIVPARLQKLPAEEQFDESTDSISKWLGDNFDPFNLGPMRINYLLDQYSGGLGDTFLPMLTPEAESGDNTTLGNILAPWKKEITTDKVLNNKNPGDFYDLKDELEKMSNSRNATEEDKMKTLYMDTVGWEMGDLYAQKREIQSSNLPDDRKYAKVRELQEQINELAKNAMSGYENVSINGLYSEVGDKRFNHDAESGKWYEIKPKNSDGSDNWYYQKEQEVTKGLGISYGEYWNNREEYNYAYDNPEKYTVAKAVGGYKNFTSYNSELWNIKADKDKNGKSINGSRKKKVVEYVNNLDADYGEKIILFKSEYPADDTYNVDIIEYLNSRDDISYQEMETILKYLGFKVDSKGNIRW